MSSINSGYASLQLPGSMPNQTLPAFMDPLASFSQPQYASMGDWGNTPKAIPAMDWQSLAAAKLGTGGFTGAGLAPATAPGFFDGMLGSTNANGIKTDGWGGLALGAVQGIGNAFMGMQQYGLAKDSLAQSKMQFEKNYNAQKTTTNAALEDRQAARVASNAGAYESVDSYMKKNGVK